MANSCLTMRRPISLILADAKRSELKRCLSAANLFSLGIFVMTGSAANWPRPCRCPTRPSPGRWVGA